MIQIRSVWCVISILLLISSSTDKLNLHLVRASQYCFQFHINVWHCSDQLNIVSDTLSCLLNKIMNAKNWSLRNTLENIDKKIYIYHITVIEMLSDFQNKIKKVYLKDKKWKKIIQQLYYFEESLADTFLYFYFMNEDLVYYLNSVNTWWWLCIFKTLKKKVFKIMHDNHYHTDFHQVYNMIVVSLFIQNLSWWLSQYIIHCLQCQHYQIVQHWSYEILQLIIELLISFHTITADFIIELLKTKTDLMQSW